MNSIKCFGSFRATSTGWTYTGPSGHSNKVRNLSKVSLSLQSLTLLPQQKCVFSFVCLRYMGWQCKEVYNYVKVNIYIICIWGRCKCIYIYNLLKMGGQCRQDSDNYQHQSHALKLQLNPQWSTSDLDLNRGGALDGQHCYLLPSEWMLLLGFLTYKSGSKSRP